MLHVSDKGRARGVALVALAVGAALAISGCSSENGNQSDPDATVDVSAYEAASQEAMSPVEEWTGPTEGPRAVENARVMWITCGHAAEGCKAPSDGAVVAADELGWDLTVVDGRFDPAVYNRSIAEATDQGYDAIVLGAISSEAVAESVRRARDAGIIVASWDGANIPADDGVSFEVEYDWVGQGEMMANYMIWKTEGKTNAHLMVAPEFKLNVNIAKGVEKAFDECATCSIAKQDNFVSSDAETRLPTLAVNALTGDPSINATISTYDASLLAVIPALESAGVADQTLVGGFNGISPMMQFIKDGRAAATVAQPQAWAAWATLDNVNRVLSGEEPVDQGIPNRLFTAENIDEATLGEPWSGDVDYASHFKAIWFGN